MNAAVPQLLATLDDPELMEKVRKASFAVMGPFCITHCCMSCRLAQHWSPVVYGELFLPFFMDVHRAASSNLCQYVANFVEASSKLHRNCVGNSAYPRRSFVVSSSQLLLSMRGQFHRNFVETSSKLRRIFVVSSSQLRRWFQWGRDQDSTKLRRKMVPVGV